METIGNTEDRTSRKGAENAKEEESTTTFMA
jgi:hypothetical protein